MTILLIDPLTSPAEPLKPIIEKSTGMTVAQVLTYREGLETLLATRQKVEIAAFTVNGNPEPTLRFIKAVNRLAATGRTLRPFLLALSITSQQPEFAARLDKFGIQLLLRKYPDQIVEAVKKLQWQARTTNCLPIITIERLGGQVVGVRVQHRGVTDRLCVGPRLRPLAAYFAVNRRTEHSTQTLADVLGISPQSVKEYLLRLRDAFDRIREKLGISLYGKDVFWTRRMPGGHVHGLKANVNIEDSEDLYFSEEVHNEAAITTRCSVCKQSNPRCRTTQSHLGSLCLECCRELHDVGEA